MRKGLTSKVGMFAMLVAAILTISATSVTGEASRVQWFTIQNNAACSSSAWYTSLYFNVNNTVSSSTDITLRLYNDAGSEITIPTQNSAGYPTGTITPGTTFTLAGKSTNHYILVVGAGTTNSCDDRPAYGKIVVESDSGLVMAGGEIKSARASDGFLYTRSDIVVNGGKPF